MSPLRSVMKKTLFHLALIPLLLLAKIGFAEDGFRPIFNGKSFDGWRNINCGPKTWSVKDGMIHCTGKPIGELRTLKMYENFILELEWRHLKPRGNAGIFVWADAYPAKGQPFHRGVEVQVLENAYGNTRGYTTHGDIFPIHGATMTPINGRGGSRAFPTENRSKPSPEWNHYRVVCDDGEISLAVNGKVVTRGTAAKPRRGYICLESEGSPVQFRNLKIKELPGTNPTPEEIATKEEGFYSLYTGVDLSGWTGDGWKSNDWRLTGGTATKLFSRKQFASYSFFADWRSQAKSVPFELPGIGPLGEFAHSKARWNRLEVTRKPGLTLITINGKVVSKKTVKDQEPLKPASIGLLPGGQFANIFIKELK